MVATVAGIHLGIDTHANRPAGNSCPDGSMYSCSTHGLIYKSNFAGNSWATWATLGAAASGSITSSGYTQNTARLLGRTTASSGAIEEITVGSGLSLSAGSLTATGGGNFVQLADSLLGSDTASFDLTSISGSYKHLRLELVLRSDRAASTFDAIKLLVNNDTGANYDYLYGSEGTGSSYPGFMTEGIGQTDARIGQASAASSNAGAVATMTLTFSDYAATTLHKHWHGEGMVELDNTTQNIRFMRAAGRWHSTSAITRLTVSPVTGSNWKTGCRATLYGLS